MSYTKQEIMDKRLCGLKHLDRALEHISRQDLIDKAIGISEEEPDIWGPNLWDNFDWAFVNAIWEELDKIEKPRERSATFNLDEALTEEEMQYVASKRGIKNSYSPVRKRIEKHIAHTKKETPFKMTSDDIKQAIMDNAANRDDVWIWGLTQNTAIKKDFGTVEEYRKKSMNGMFWSKEYIKRWWKKKVDGKIERGFSVMEPCGLFVVTRECADGTLEIEYYNGWANPKVYNCTKSRGELGLVSGAKPLFLTKPVTS